MADLKTTNIYGDAYINNKVGIATNAPATRLQIGQLSPTAATEGIQFGDDTGTRIYRSSTGTLTLNGSVVIAANGLNLSASTALQGNYGDWSGESNKIQWHANNLYFVNRGGGSWLFRNSAGSNVVDIASNGTTTVAGTITAPSATVSGYITFPNDTTAAGLINTANTAWLRLDDVGGNMHMGNSQTGAGIYCDSNAFYWRTANAATTLLSLNSNGDLGAARYLSGTYVTTSDDTSSTTVSYIMAKFGDNFHRSAPAAKVATFLSGQTMNIVGTSTNITAYTINQNVGTANSPSFAGLTVAGGNATIYRDLIVNGGGSGNFGNRIIVQGTATTYTYQDTTLRPTVYLNGDYPVVTLNATATTNANHGPTLQFAFNGLTTGGATSRQIVIGANGVGSWLDFGFSGGANGDNSSYNPHNGISGYNGVTAMRLFSNGLLVGSTGAYPNNITSISYALDVRGTGYFSSTLTVGGNISAANLSGTNTGDQSIGNGTITIAAGTGVSVGATNTFTTNQSGATTVTVTNSGVTSNVAGTGISVSGATGAVTITNSSPNATHTGDVTGATSLTIANDAVTTVKILNANVTNAKLANSSVTIGSTAVSLGATVTTFAGLASVTSTAFVGALTGTASGNLTAASTLTAGNLSGTIPSGVLGNSTLYVGSTAIALNRASAGQTLTGISIDGNSGGIYAAGQAFIQTTSVGTSYVQHIQVREAAGGSGLTSETYAPALGFHWAGIVASNILMEASGRISIRNNPGTGYENFIAATITAGTSFSGAGTGLTGTAASLTAGAVTNGIYTTSVIYIGTTAITMSRSSAAQTLTGVSIDGNAATVTNATFYRQFTVRDDRSDGGDYSLAGRPTGLYAISAAGTNGPGATYLSLIHVANGSDVAFQIAGGYNSDAMYFRGTTALQSGTGYSAWRTVIHSGNIASQTVTSCTGNAGTATILQTARNINGTSFNGSAAITTANWGTARTLTIGSTGKSVDGSAAVSWSLAEIGAAATNQTMFVGTTSVAINRASAAQTLTGVSIDGNAATATGQQSGVHFTLNTGGVGYGLVGAYDPDKHQGLFAMGPSYTLAAGGTLANFYGVSWSYDYAGRQLNTGYNLQHCMAVANAGVVATVIGLGIWTNGLIRANGAISSAGTITAASFSGAGTSLTGTATSLSIGGAAASATFLNSSNYIQRIGGSGNYNTDFQNTPAGSVRHQGDDATSTNNPGGTWWFVDNYRHSNASNYWGTQVAWGWEDQANRLATRNVTGGTFGGWVYYLNSANYNSYSPTLTGTGASGTWSINVTGNAGGSSTSCSGNAATATKASTLSQGGGTGTGMTFNWSGQSGQPTWLWGSNDGTNIYVWNPSNFSVNYATSAGTATNAGTAGALITVNSYTVGNLTANGMTQLAGVKETYVAVAPVSNVVTLDLNAGTVFRMTYNSVISSFTLSNVTAGKVNAFTLISIASAGAGGINFTFTGYTLKWAGGTTPTATYIAGKFDVFSFVFDGTNWYGFTGGLNY